MHLIFIQALLFHAQSCSSQYLVEASQSSIPMHVGICCWQQTYFHIAVKMSGGPVWVENTVDMLSALQDRSEPAIVCHDLLCQCRGSLCSFRWFQTPMLFQDVLFHGHTMVCVSSFHALHLGDHHEDARYVHFQRCASVFAVPQ